MYKMMDSIVPQIVAAARRRFSSVALLPFAFVAAGLLAGCQHKTYFDPPKSLNTQAAQTGGLTTRTNESLSLREGDVLRILFPGSPTLDSTQVDRKSVV